MKGRFILLICCLLFISVTFSGCFDVKKESGTEDLSNDVIYQTSTIGALLEGMYEGDVTVGDLKERGDLGLEISMGLTEKWYT
jgi:acetolactate decarboxylase